VLPEMAIQLVLTTDRTAVGRLLSMSKFTDMSFCFIEDHRKDYSVRLMCDVFEVSPAGYYAWRERAVGERATANARLLAEEIRRVPQESDKRYSKSAGPCRVAGAGTRHASRRGRRRWRLSLGLSSLFKARVRPSGQSRSTSTRPQAEEMRA
jgi:hypothetical protein